MCTWMTSLNKHSKAAGGGNKKRSLVLSMKPCPDEKSYYRFRLLAFNGNSGRDDPHIERFVHQHWGVNKEKGYPVLEDEITCPVTSYVNVEGNRYDACKVCTAANKYFITFKESNWKDKDACKKNKEFGRKYQAIVPVYVVNDPNYEGNNGKFRVLIFNDKKFYQEFRKKIEAASRTLAVFNGSNAVDCYMHMSEVVEILHEGEPNEYHWKKRVIDKYGFTTKPYDIPSITKDMVDQMEFDDQYYTTSTPEEIDAFYRKYCTVSNDDIPADDEVKVFDAPTAEAQVQVSLSNHEIKTDASDISIDDLTSDPDDLPAASEPVKDKPAQDKPAGDDIDPDALMAELGL